jgi:hypothetical protein
MTVNGWLQIAVFTAIVIALARLLGGYMRGALPFCARSSGEFTRSAASTSARSSIG